MEREARDDDVDDDDARGEDAMDATAEFATRGDRCGRTCCPQLGHLNFA